MSEPILNANRENMTERYGEKAEERFRELCDLGGHGDVSIDYAGGIGILGALREENTAISPQAKERIAEICGVDRKADVDNHKGVGAARRTPSEPKAE